MVKSLDIQNTSSRGVLGMFLGGFQVPNLSRWPWMMGEIVISSSKVTILTKFDQPYIIHKKTNQKPSIANLIRFFYSVWSSFCLLTLFKTLKLNPSFFFRKKIQINNKNTGQNGFQESQVVAWSGFKNPPRSKTWRLFVTTLPEEIVVEIAVSGGSLLAARLRVSSPTLWWKDPGTAWR